LFFVGSGCLILNVPLIFDNASTYKPLFDYYDELEKENKEKYAIANAGLPQKPQEETEQKDQEYVLKQSDVMKDYNETTVRKSF